jgi:hypothetical protein
MMGAAAPQPDETTDHNQMKSVMGPLYTQMQRDGAALHPVATSDGAALHPDTICDGYPSLLTWKSSRLFGAFQGVVEGDTSDQEAMEQPLEQGAMDGTSDQSLRNRRSNGWNKG